MCVPCNVMQGMVAGKRSRGKPNKIMKYTTGTVDDIATAHKVAEDKHIFRIKTFGQRRHEDDNALRRRNNEVI